MNNRNAIIIKTFNIKGFIMISKYLLSLALIVNICVAMERPVYQPPFRRNQPVRSQNKRSQIPAIQVEGQEIQSTKKPQDTENLFDYFKRLAAVETRLTQLVTNAKDYQMGKEELEEIIDNNGSLTDDDKKDLRVKFTQELRDKFFPKRNSPMRRPVVIN